MKEYKTSITVCMILFIVAAFCQLLYTSTEKMANVGMWALILAVIYFFAGIILCIPKISRQFGQGMLVSAGLCFLIGLGICSFFQVKI
jgi:hypothetical protein